MDDYLPLLMAFGPLAFIPLFLLLDLLPHAQSYRSTRWWKLRALAVSLAGVGVSFGTGLLWERVWVFPSLLDLSWLGVMGAAVGVVVYEFFHYWFHRGVHRFSFTWRWFHQMHHAPERFDAYSAFYQSPLDAVAFTSIGIVVAFPLLGLSPEAGALLNAFLMFNAMFQHANIKTPRWLGYIIQRPESHSVHHARGVHMFNYCDLPMWDMLFGTFRNPPNFAREVGLYDGASARIGAMLVGRDLRPEQAPVAARDLEEDERMAAYWSDRQARLSS
ncbi:fatty acid hydroxylase family protein [bacterium]|nr:MAG: fatty acid hydroxylase family protein [bacterium]RIK63739.1 MAG: fatty acid hydroxylase [Planctomycetota bacterium]